LLKKRYIILVSGIVSVLLGSLLYTNLALAGKPEPQPQVDKDTVKIDLKSCRISTETDPHINATLPFTFNPKGHNFNLTRMWISFITGGNFWHSIDFNLNGATAITLNYFTAYPDTITSFETDVDFYGAIVEGINVLTASEIYRDPMIPTTEYIFYMSLFIEYEY